MSKPGLAFGLNLTRRPGPGKPPPPKGKAMFGDDDDSDNEAPDESTKVEDIGGDLDDALGAGKPAETSDLPKPPTLKSKGGPPTQPPKLKSKVQPNTMFGDLSSSLTSRKNAEAASELDPSVYEYDSVYDSIKSKKKALPIDDGKNSRYMMSLMKAAQLRKRDALIAEEKKIAREREAEGEEFDDKEKFVTEAYKKQQAENKRIEEEERKREELEAKKNRGGGMSAFYKKMLEQDDQRHAQTLKAAENVTKDGPSSDHKEHDGVETEKSEADIAKELNDKGASVAVNEDGQVVDKRQLLRGGLNIGAKKKETVQQDVQRPADNARRPIGGLLPGRKQAMRERQSRMLEEQLEQSMKRSRADEDAQKEEVERAAKSRKTEGEISGAKERYLARKRAAEEAKKNETAPAQEA